MERRVRFLFAFLIMLSISVAVTVGLIYALPPATDAADAPADPSPSSPASPSSPSPVIPSPVIPSPVSPSPVSPSSPGECAYTPLDDARPWGCRPNAPSTYPTAAAARAACSSASTCKGYYRASPGYATASFLPSECLAPGTAVDTPAEFHAKASHATYGAPYVPQGAWKRIEGSRVGSCGSSIGSAAQHNSTYRVCADSDKSSERCAYFASGYLDPAMCVRDPEPVYSAFVPKLGTGAGFGPAQTKNPPIVASCSFRTVRHESDAKCLCAADPKCAGYYRTASGSSALSLAEPGKCEVDWQLNKATIDKAKDRCSLLGPKWATNATYPEKYCVPVGGCSYGTNEVLCGTALIDPPCPAGWTVEGTSCRAPCPAPQQRGQGGWCVMSSNSAQPCPRGFQKFTKQGHGNLCVPTALEIESILQSAMG